MADTNSKMTKVDGKWQLPITITSAGETSSELSTQGKYLDANIVVKTSTAAAVAETTNPGNIPVSMTIGTVSSGVYPVTFNGESKEVTTTVTSAGWIAEGTAGTSRTIGITGSGSISESTITDVTTGSSPKVITPTTADQYVKIGSGYNHADRYIKVAGEPGATPAEWKADAPDHSVTDPSVTPKINITGGLGYGITSTAPATGSYVTFDPDAEQVAGTSKAKSNATVTAGGKVAKDDTRQSAEDTKAINVTVGGGTTQYMPVVTTQFTNGGWDISTDDLSTRAGTAEINSTGTFKTSTTYGVTTTKPAGTDGTNYLTIDGTLSTTDGEASSSWTAKHKAVTVSNAAGAIAAQTDATAMAAENKSGGKTGVAVDITETDNFDPLYIPVVAANVTGGTLSKTDATVSPTATASATGSSVTLGTAVEEAPTSGRYITVSGGSQATSGNTTATMADVKLSNAAGAIAANDNVTKIASATVTSDVTVSSSSKTLYYPVDSVTYANTATEGVTYTDIDDKAPVLISGGYLYINKGYEDNVKISLKKLVPNKSDVKGHGDYILNGHSAYDDDGTLVGGTIADVIASDITVTENTTSGKLQATLPTAKYTTTTAIVKDVCDIYDGTYA